MITLLTGAELSSFLVGHGITMAYDITFMNNRIAAASTWLQKKLNHTYGLDNAASARLYDGSGTDELIIDGCQEIAAVAGVDEAGTAQDSYSATEDYRAQPYNEDTKRSLRLHTSIWPRGRGHIQVTAKWGEGDAPDDVKEAATQASAIGVLLGPPQVGGSMADNVKSYSTGVYEVVFNDKGTEIATWSTFIDSVIEANQDERPF